MVTFYNKKLKNHVYMFRINGKGLNVHASAAVFEAGKSKSNAQAFA
jgi:hypothetical protein